MNTVHSLVTHLIDPKTVMDKVKSILREVDSDCEKEEQAFIEACTVFESGIDDSISISAKTYLEAMDAEMASDFIFVIGRGFKLNLDIHNNPVNALALKLDYEDLHEERKMHMLPASRKASKITYAFLEELRASHRDKLDLLTGIDSYYNYLRTIGYKVAHYYGFVLADQLLPHLIPGYYADSVYVSTYGLILNKDMEHHGGRSTAVQRYTEDATLFTQQSGTLAVGQTCGFSVSISTFRDNNPDVTGVTIGTDEGSLCAATIRSCGDRTIYQDGRAEAEGVRHQAAFYQGVKVHTSDSFSTASFPRTLQQAVLIAVHSGTPKILARSVAEFAASDYSVVQVGSRVATVYSKDRIQSVSCMGCGFESIIVFAVGTGSTKPGVVGELEVGDVAPGIFIPFLGDGNVTSGIAVGLGIAAGVLGRVGCRQVGSIDIGFCAIVINSAPALVADASPLNGFAVAQRAYKHIVGAGARADIDIRNSIDFFHNIHKGFNRRFCRNFCRECGVRVGSFCCGRIGFSFRGDGRFLSILRGRGGDIRAVSGCGCAICGRSGAFGRTGGFEDTGFIRIFLAENTSSERGHHADDQERGQDFLESIAFHELPPF